MLEMDLSSTMLRELSWPLVVSTGEHPLRSLKNGMEIGTSLKFKKVGQNKLFKKKR